MKKNVISVIFKDGNTAIFEYCLDVYEMHEMLLVYFQCPESHIMHCEYPYKDVACVINGYADTVRID